MTSTRIMSGLVSAIALMFGTTAAALPQNQTSQPPYPNQIGAPSNSVAASAPDNVTTSQVSAALNRDKSLRFEDIRVQAMLGVVTLTGAVESSQQFHEAEQIASSVKGVKAVNNQLTIITLSSEFDSGESH